jgi:hypothetical protein
MTNVNTTQEDREQLLDRVVPPPPRMSRWVGLVLAMILVAGLAVTAHVEGLAAPSFQIGGSDWSTGPAPSGHGAEFSFSFQSSRLVPVTLDGIDASAPGLANPQMTYWTDAGGTERPLSLPIRLSKNELIEVRITWTQLGCGLITPGESYAFPVHYSNELGWNATVSVAMLWGRPNANGIYSQPGVGWPEGVSWTACGHPVNTAPGLEPT